MHRTHHLRDVNRPANTHGPCAAIFDVGRSFAKLSIVTACGDVLSEARVGIPAQHTGVYGALDTDTLFNWLLAQLKAVAALHPIDRIIPVAHGAACAFIDADGHLVQPIQDYDSPIPNTVAADYARRRPGFDETLSPPLPKGLNLGAQIFWHARRDPEMFARVKTIVPYAQYWAWRLSGELASEITSLGCHSDLWSPTRGDFSSLAHDEGWARRFAPLRQAWDTLGTLRPEIALATGLDGVRVLCGVHDTNAALSASLHHWNDQGNDGNDWALLSTGTWFIAMAPGASLNHLKAERDCLGAVDIYGRPVPCARFMGGRAYQIITRGRGGAVPIDAATLRTVMQDSALALPSFLDAGGPYPGHRGEIRDLAHDNSQTRAALGMLYQALVSHTCLNLIQSGRPLLIEGMAARNPTLCGLIAALHEAPVYVNAEVSGVTLGATALAFHGEAPAPKLNYSRAEPLLTAEVQAYGRLWTAAVDAHAA